MSTILITLSDENLIDKILFNNLRSNEKVIRLVSEKALNSYNKRFEIRNEEL